MIIAPIPTDEARRLAAPWALKLAGTPAEERFDRISRLAVQLFDLPIAHVTLLDPDRQRFKSMCGPRTDHTWRDGSLLGHAIVGKEPLILPDGRLDPRFHDNPLVIGEPYPRFHAGIPLAVGAESRNVGTFRIADLRARSLDAE